MTGDDKDLAVLGDDKMIPTWTESVKVLVFPIEPVKY